MTAMLSAPRSPQSDPDLQLANDVRRALLSEDGLQIASLVVRRIPNGVCLEGIVRVSGDDVDVCKSVRKLSGIGEILNHLTVCWNCPEQSAGTVEEESSFV